MIIQSLGLRN